MNTNNRLRGFSVITRFVCVLVLYSVIQPIYAQNNAITQYNEFKQQAQKTYSDFRKKCNAEYADFLEKAWKSYEAGPVIPKPKEEDIPPVVIPKEDINKPIESNPIPIDTVVAPVIEEREQPKPVAPIYEQAQPIENKLSFMFFGTQGMARIPVAKKDIAKINNDVSGKCIANAWETLSSGEYDNLIRDCLEMRIRYQLSDWAYLMMLNTLSETYYGNNSNSATLFLAWTFCQSGYQMKLATAGNKLYLLFASKHRIYDTPYYVLNGMFYYPFQQKGTRLPNNMMISDASFPNEQPLSLYMNKAHHFAEKFANERQRKSERYPVINVSVRINQNLMDFYSTYPTSMIGDNFCTRWAMYANTPMADNVKEQVYPHLRSCINGLSQLDAVNRLLNWVQTGFEYEYDDKVWGGDRAFFAEESLNYPYCDCEDRSILFTRLVRDLLGLKCILIYYPGHLAAAVNFTDDVEGDYIMLNGKRFVVTDPTFIGAPVGYTMTGMDNKTATVILLE